MKTKSISKKEALNGWVIADVSGKILGRVATVVAAILQGKHKATWTPSLDNGDHVILINAGEVRLTGKKELQKQYFSHSTYPGGEKIVDYKIALAKDPCFPLVHAIKGMLPKTSLGQQMFTKLHIYPAGEHPHAAQKPAALTL